MDMEAMAVIQHTMVVIQLIIVLQFPFRYTMGDTVTATVIDVDIMDKLLENDATNLD